MKPIKLCFVVPQAYKYFNHKVSATTGGAERQVFYLGRELAQDKRFRVHYCVADYGQDEVEIYGRIKVWKSFLVEDSKPRATAKLYKVLKKINAHVYVFRAPDIGVFVAMTLVKLGLRKKFMYMIASDSEVFAPPKDKEKLKWKLMGLVYKRSNILTAQTLYQKKTIKKVKGVKVTGIVKNSYDFKLQPKDLRLNEKETILWVGRCDQMKRAEIFLELARQHPQLPFVIIAPPAVGQKDYQQQVKREASGVANLTFVDFVPPEEITGYYVKAKIYVTTSEFEGFSNTMMEAMEACCPIVSLNINPDDILDKFELGFCTNDNQTQFFKQFKELIAQPNLMYEMGQNARAYLEQHHNTKASGDVLKQLLISHINSQ